jgi:hypothetical protein
MSRLSTTAATEGAKRTVTRFTIGLERMLSAHRLDRVERRRIGEPTVHFLMSVSAIS